MLVLLIAIALALAVVGFVWLTYNRMVARRNAVDNSWSQIDVELKRRHDLIPRSEVPSYAAVLRFPALEPIPMTSG